ncbi:hypothetical protein HDU76_009113 [Blyttiomyces sp. JEL0837]|nr:hypothetical protein HDU76_009113 [Blyttiomyces sp. JEL0837]
MRRPGPFPLSDPRREDAIIPFEYPKAREQDVETDLFGFIAIIAGVVGLLLKSPGWVWGALIAATVSLLTTKGTEKEFRQGAGNVSFALMTLLLTYGQRVMMARKAEEMESAL